MTPDDTHKTPALPTDAPYLKSGLVLAAATVAILAVLVVAATGSPAGSSLAVAQSPSLPLAAHADLGSKGAVRGEGEALPHGVTALDAGVDWERVERAPDVVPLSVAAYER